MTHGGLPRHGSLLLVATLGIAAACGSLERPAGPEAPKTIAFLRAVAGTGTTEPALLQELRGAGFIEGRNLTVLADDPEEVYAEPEEVQEVLEEWRERRVDLIVALSSAGAMAAHRMLPDANILFLSNDPTALGLVRNEAHPEGRMTGVTFRVPADRTLDLTLRALPSVKQVGLAYAPDDPAGLPNRDAVAEAAGELGVELLLEEFTGPDDVGGAVASLAERGADVLLLSNSPTAVRVLAETEAAARAHRLPVVANTSFAASAVIALYPDSEELARQLGRQAARLLSGSSPSAIPVEDPRRFLITVNAVAAAELGIDLPQDVTREAHQVIRG